MKRLQKIVCFILMVLMVGSLCVAITSSIKVKADTTEVGTLKTLFENANTGYECSPILNQVDTNYENKQNKVNFTVNSQVINKPVMESANATVLMHGYGATDGVWSNTLYNNSSEAFGYDSESLIQEIINLYGGNVELYSIKFNLLLSNSIITLDDLKLNFIVERLNLVDYSKLETNLFFNIDTLDTGVTFDTTKHNLFIFNISDSSASHENTYFLYNYALSRIAINMKASHGSKLPKFNLIGHSRGGIINLMYAMDHPYMVENLISIGTPYNGSTTATVFGEMLDGETDALNDIVNTDVHRGLRNRWNSNLSLYSQINAVALSSYSSMTFLAEAVIRDKSESFSLGEKLAIEGGILAVSALKFFLDNPLNIIQNLGKHILADILYNSLPSSYGLVYKASALAQIFFNELVFEPNLSFRNDVLVDLNSQNAFGYNGFTRRIKKYTLLDGTNFNKVAQNDVPVPHNLEPRDKDIIGFVIEELQEGNKLYYEDLVDGNLGVTGLKGQPLGYGTISGTTWTLPTQIDGKTITEIGSFAFDTNLEDANITKIIIPSTVKRINPFAFYGANTLTEVVIPSSVEYIGEEAFGACTSLTTINIPSSATNLGGAIFAGCSSLSNVTLSSSINKIPTGMFTNCSSLTSITLPSSVNDIGEYAFLGCSNLQTVAMSGVTVISDFAFYQCVNLNMSLQSGLLEIGDYAFAYCNSIPFTSLPNSVTRIGDGAFAGCSFNTFTLPRSLLSLGENIFMLCPNLTAIYVNSANTNFVSVNGVLYNYNQTELISYPIAKTGTSYVAPTSVVTVSGNAFINNQNLQSITLPNVTHIGDNAFACCSNLTQITSPNVTAVSYNAFLETAWLTNNNTDRVVLGKAFLKYKGSASIVDLSEFVYIDDYAFVDNNTIEEVILGDNIKIIGDGAFNGCSNFNKLTIYANKVVSVTDEFFTNLRSDFVICVPQSVITDYVASEFWTSTATTYQPITSTVNYYDGNSLVATQTAYYGNKFSHINYLPSMAEVNGWKESVDLSGEYFTELIKWDKKESVLNLYLDKTVYNCSVTYALNGGELPKAVSYFNSGTSFTLPIPSREGYSFNGWYLDSALTNKLEVLSATQAQNFTVYASWLSGYSGYYVQLYSPLGDYNGTYTFENDLIGSHLPSVEVNGVNFLGWFTSQTGGTQITDASGIVISNNFASGSTLYAQFQSYAITYELAQGINNSQNPTNYNFYISTFILQPAYKGGYRFMGWKLDDKQYVTEINSQIRDDITLFAHFEKEYILIFDEKGGSSCNDIAVVQGEEITLPSSSKLYYHGYWKIGTKEYDFNSKYVFNVATAGQIIGGKIEIDATWWGNEYFINYIYLGINYPSISYFNYGKKTELTPLRLRVDNTFEGFYTDANFTNKIKYIPADSSELLEEARVSAGLDVALYINVYIKWKELNLSFMSHSGAILVTDSGRWNQEYIALDVIYNTLNNRANYSSFNSIKFVISLDIWEYNDGYQYLFLYDKYDEDNSTMLWGVTIEHDADDKNTTAHRYTFEFRIDIPEFTTTTFDQRFFLMFGASGKSDDDWYNDNREISIYLSTEQPNNSTDNYVVWP